MKFKLDENLGAVGKSMLEAQGYDVMTVRDQKLSGTSDMRLYEVCRDEGRVLVTLDHDFSQTLRFPPEASAGIIVLQFSGRQSMKSIAARVAELIELLRNRTIERELWIVEPGRVRIHERRSND